MFDGLGLRVRFLEFLGGVFEILSNGLDVVLELLVTGVEPLVIIEVLVLDLVVLLPGDDLGAAHNDLDAVVLDGAGEGLTETPFGDECFDGFLYLRTQGFERFFVLVGSDLCCEKLVNNFKICLHLCYVLIITHVNYQIRNIPFLVSETENVVPDAPLTNYPGEDFF